MAEQTANYKLTKPLLTEFYDVEVQNDNMDIIDTALKENADAAANLVNVHNENPEAHPDIMAAVKKAQDTADGVIKVISEIVIPPGAWKNEGEGEYGYTADAESPQATADAFPCVALHIESLDCANAAGLSPTVQSLDGAIRFFAKKAPENDISATAALLMGGNGSGSGGGGEKYVLPIASRTRLGGVKIGDGITIAGDGTITSSAKVSDSDKATSEDTTQMLDEVFAQEE